MPNIPRNSELMDEIAVHAISELMAFQKQVREDRKIFVDNRGSPQDFIAQAPTLFAHTPELQA